MRARGCTRLANASVREVTGGGFEPLGRFVFGTRVIFDGPCTMEVFVGPFFIVDCGRLVRPLCDGETSPVPAELSKRDTLPDSAACRPQHGALAP